MEPTLIDTNIALQAIDRYGPRKTLVITNAYIPRQCLCEGIVMG